MQHVLVSTACAVAQNLVAHKAAVDIAKLLVSAGACGVGNASAAPHPDGSLVALSAISSNRRTVHPLGKMRDAHCGCAVVHPYRALDKLMAQHIAQPRIQRCFWRALADSPLFDQFALVPDLKAHIGARQRVAAHRLHTVRQLGGVGLEKLAPRGGAEEQLFHLHRGAGAAGHGFQLAAAPIQGKSIKLAASP